jgi:hypothetical protein
MPSPIEHCSSGDPTGTWILKSYEPILSATQIYVRMASEVGLTWTPVGSCSVELAAPGVKPVNRDVRLALLKNGSGGVFGEDKSTFFDLRYGFLESCAIAAVAKDGRVDSRTVTCDSLTYPGACPRSACGVCGCESSGPLPDFQFWSYSETALILDNEKIVDYCMIDDETLTTASDGMRFRWARFEAGSPAPCGARALAQCDSESAPAPAGCHEGRCEWAGNRTSSPSDCMAQDSELCDALFGCKWTGVGGHGEKSATGGRARHQRSRCAHRASHPPRPPPL